MIRYEIKTTHGPIVGYESNITDAKAYVAGLVNAGVEIVTAEYFDRDARETAIMAGEV